MELEKDQPPDPNSVNFMLEEYRMLQGRYESLWSEGVTRLNFFVTLTSALLAGMALIGSGGQQNPTFFKLILLAILLLLSAIGLDLYQFILMRARVVDKAERGMRRIRRYFIEQDHSLKDYVTFAYHDEPTDYLFEKHGSNVRRTTQLILACIAGIACGLIADLLALPLEVALSVGVIAFVIDFALMEYRARRYLAYWAQRAKAEIRFSRTA